MALACYSRNHTNTALEVRERLHFPEDAIGEALRTLQEEAGLAECCLLCTCNRTELYFVDYSRSAAAQIPEIVAHMAGVPALAEDTVSVLEGQDAIRHLFRVAAGLESRLLGENEILGQVKTAYRLACEAETNGYFVNAAFHRAFRVGKRVRTDLDLNAGGTSVGTVAVDHAKQACGNLPAMRVLVIGTGDVAELVLRALATHTPKALHVAGRRPKRAKGLADRYGGQSLELAEIGSALPQVDLVFSATASPGYVLTPAFFTDAPVRVYDFALPRDVDPEVGELEGVTLHNIDDVLPLVTETMTLRNQEIPKAEALVEAAVEDDARWLQELAAVPSIRRLLEVSREVWQHEMGKLHKAEHSDADIALAERSGRRILHSLTRSIMDELKRTARDAADPNARQDYWRLLDDEESQE